MMEGGVAEKPFRVESGRGHRDAWLPTIEDWEQAMEYRSYSISPEVFTRFPGYVRGVVIAYEVTNGASPPELVETAAPGGGIGPRPGGARAGR